MTVEEKSKKIEQYCHVHWTNHDNCIGCPLYQFAPFESCYENPDFVNRNYEILFGTEDSNPYWGRITQMADRQRKKGIDTYGQGLEANIVPDALKRIEYIQEELIDGLMYLEWLKEKLKGESENA